MSKYQTAAKHSQRRLLAYCGKQKKTAKETTMLNPTTWLIIEWTQIGLTLLICVGILYLTWIYGNGKIEAVDRNEREEDNG